MAEHAISIGAPGSVADLARFAALAKIAADSAPTDFDVEAGCAMLRFARAELHDAPIRNRADAIIKMETWRDELAEALEDHSIADQVIDWLRGEP